MPTVGFVRFAVVISQVLFFPSNNMIQDPIHIILDSLSHNQSWLSNVIKTIRKRRKQFLTTSHQVNTHQ